MGKSARLVIVGLCRLDFATDSFKDLERFALCFGSKRIEGRISHALRRNQIL